MVRIAGLASNIDLRKGLEASSCTTNDNTCQVNDHKNKKNRKTTVTRLPCCLAMQHATTRENDPSG